LAQPLWVVLGSADDALDRVCVELQSMHALMAHPQP